MSAWCWGPREGEGDELVTYDLAGLTQLLEYDTKDEYTIDND